MSTYQLRLRNGKGLEQVVDELTHMVTLTFARYPDFFYLNQNDYVTLRELIHRTFEGTMHTYDVCGSQMICDMGLLPTDWTPDEMMPITIQCPSELQRVKRIQLVVGDSLEEVLNLLESLIFEKFFQEPSDRACLVRPIKPQLDVVIKKALGPYLYRNVACGACDLCQHRQEIDPWKTASNEG